MAVNMKQFIVPEYRSSGRGFLGNPISLGAVVGAIAAAYPCTPNPDDFLEGLIDPVQWAMFENAYILAFRVTSAVIGFIIGYGVARAMSWLRWRAIEILLSYREWMYHPNAITTKAWGLSLKLLEGHAPHYTYTFQEVLPKQPLPDLDKTLDRYLYTTKNYITPKEFEETRSLVESFRRKEGPRIQAYLNDRANKCKSWLADYWMDLAYLGKREPIPINSNYFFSNKILSTTNPLARATLAIQSTIQYSEYFKQNRVPAVIAGDIIPLCMDPYRVVFNTIRIPGEHRDEVKEYPEDKYFVVLRNGHYFKLDVYATDETGNEVALSRWEIREQLQHIHDVSERLGFGTEIAALTTLERPTWAKLRNQIRNNNANRAAMDVIERAMGMIVLDTNASKDNNMQLRWALVGDGTNRWFDKNFNFIVFGDASVAANIEHSGIDGMVFSSICDYVFVQESTGFDEHGDLILQENETFRKLIPPTRLEWELDDVAEHIKTAKDSFLQLVDTLELCSVTLPYGKGFMKRKKLSPDSYLQMALQLAYYRVHKSTPKTYEPATLRMFKLGRTDTIHSVSDYSIAWTKAMTSGKASTNQKADLLRKAMDVHKRFTTDATAGRGCDRHMTALNCAAKELGMKPPIFEDKAYSIPFKLSTSTIPVNYVKHNPNLDFKYVVGGFGPVTTEGYAACYVHHGDNITNIYLANWKNQGTDSKKMADEMMQAMEDMRRILS